MISDTYNLYYNCTTKWNVQCNHGNIRQSKNRIGGYLYYVIIISYFLTGFIRHFSSQLTVCLCPPSKNSFWASLRECP